MWDEFKQFINRGNVLELAVAVIVGGAFGKMVSTLVDHVLMPPIGLLLGRVDFSDLYINLSSRPYPSFQAAQTAGAPTIAYGLFINTVLDFLIVSILIFVGLRWIRTMEPHHPAPPDTKSCPFCLTAVPLKATRCPHCTSDL